MVLNQGGDAGNDTKVVWAYCPSSDESFAAESRHDRIYLVDVGWDGRPRIHHYVTRNMTLSQATLDLETYVVGWARMDWEVPSVAAEEASRRWSEPGSRQLDSQSRTTNSAVDVDGLSNILQGKQTDR